MYTLVSMSLEFDEIIFGFVFDSFCSIFSFFPMRFVSFQHTVVILHLTTLRRLLLETCISAFCGKKQT